MGALRRSSGAAVVLPFAALASLALARPAVAADAAADPERLFEQARALMDQGRYAEACAKLESSEAQDPGIGTEFNLARCYDLAGRLASARAMYRRVVEETHAAGQTDRETVARDLSAQLQPRVARLVLHVVAPPPALEIRVDDTPVTGTDWSLPVELDPGSHDVVATAPGLLPWRTSVRVTGEAESITLDVPPLVPRAAVLPVLARAVPPSEQTHPGRSQRIVALALGAAGVVSLVPGAYFGARAISLESQANGECQPSAPYACSSPGYTARQQSISAGNLSTVAFVVGGVLLGAAGVVWFTAPGGP